MNRIRKGYELRFRQRLAELGSQRIESEVARLLERAEALSTEKGISVTEAFAEVEQSLGRGPEAKAVTEPEQTDYIFLCDAGLGGLARWLRAAGQRAMWQESIADDQLVKEGRRLDAVMITTDSLIMERKVVRDRLIRSLWLPPTLTISQQLERVFREFRLVRKEPRCMTCGGELIRKDKETMVDRIPPKTYRWLDEYFVCADCDKLFWKGTHWSRIEAELKKAIG